MPNNTKWASYDKVSEVLDISEDAIESPPSFGVSTDTGYLLGMAKINDKIKILLDIEKIISAEEIASISSQIGNI